MKRVKIVPDRPNRLFEIWLEEWKNEAVLRNSELRYHFAKALDSLKRYPLPLESGRECIILQHFGTKLCSMLDKRLEEYRRQESAAALDAHTFASSEDCAAASRFVEEDIIEIQEETVVRQAKNTEKNASRNLVNANEIVAKDIAEEIYIEPNTFDILLLVDTRETCG